MASGSWVDGEGSVGRKGGRSGRATCSSKSGFPFTPPNGNWASIRGSLLLSLLLTPLYPSLFPASLVVIPLLSRSHWSSGIVDCF